MGSGTSTNGSRATLESSAHSVIRGAMPEAIVPSATSTPTTRTSWCGFGSLQSLHERKRYCGCACARRFLQVGLVGGGARGRRAASWRSRGASSRPSNARWPTLASSIGVGDHARVARRPVEEGEVAEEAAGAERRRPLCPWRSTRARPSTITKNSAPAAPSGTTTLPAATVDVLGRLRHQLQLLLGAGGEERDGREGLDEGVAPGHAQECIPDGQVVGNVTADTQS